MGLGSFLLNLAEGFVNTVVEKAERIDGIKSKYEKYDDTSLKRELKSSGSDEKKMAIVSILKDRGYGKD